MITLLSHAPLPHLDSLVLERVHKLHLVFIRVLVNIRWLRFHDDIQYHMSWFTDSPLVNGSIRFLSRRTGSFSLSTIVAFDMKAESFLEIAPPKDFDFGDLSTHNRIGDLGGKLCVFCGHANQDVQIWVMEEYGVADSWSKQSELEDLRH